MFRNYVQSMVMGKPFQPMFEADGGQGGAGNGDGGQDDKGADGGGDGQKDDGGQDEPVKFDDRQQAELQKIIDRTIAKERKRAEKEKQDALDREKLSAEQKAELDRQNAQKAAEEKERKANERIVNLEIKDVARELGVAAKKLDRFMKVIDRDDLAVDEDGNVDRSKVLAAVKAVLADMPEFKGTDSKGPGADFGGGNPGGAKYSMAQIQTMSPKEIAADYDEVQKSLKIHQTKK